METLYLEILKEVGMSDVENLDGFLIERDCLINEEVYKRMKPKLDGFKDYFSSSLLTCLQDNAENKQVFPLINIIRQLLKTKYYTMEPIRKANGYDKGGKKLYKRYFRVKKMIQ
jgi:hypothetical protein